MDNRQFNAAYEPLGEKYIAETPERRELMQAPRDWMRFFDELLSSYLEGDQAPDNNEMTGYLHDYYRWYMLDMPAIKAEAAALHTPDQYQDDTDEFRFHDMNGPVVFLWHQLLYADAAKYTTADLSGMQAHLAVSMIPENRRFHTLRANTHTREEPGKESEQISGTLTEGDSLITGLEVMKEYRDLVVLPAPIRFEANQRQARLNFDQIVVDTERRHARGAQAKSRTRSARDIDRYDHYHVDVIDGVTDLGNTEYSKLSPNRTAARPGLLGMQLLSTRSIKDVPPAFTKMEYMKNRRQAQEMTKNNGKSYLGQAAINFANRIIPNLYE